MSELWSKIWSKPAALRAVRATLVVPGLFALCNYVIGDAQMATFAAFGGFATLVLAAFGGERRDRAAAHLGLALTGSVLLVIGTLVSFSPLVAALATVPVAFAVLFGGILGPNAASGGLAAMLAYVLPAASPGAVEMIPSRLAGWWLASVAGTAAVLLLSPRPPADRLRATAADLADALAAQLGAALHGAATEQHRNVSIAAKYDLLASFTGTPYRPVGLTTAGRALENLVGLLEWCTAVVCDSLREYTDLRSAPPAERDLLAATAATLSETAGVLRGEPTEPDLDRLEQRLAASITHLDGLDVDAEGYDDVLHVAFHARTAAVAARSAGADALIAARRATPEVVERRRRGWYGVPDRAAPDVDDRRRWHALPDRAAPDVDDHRREHDLPGRAAPPRVGVARGLWRDLVARHASMRSVWLVNSLRGAVALAVAVGLADATGVAHGFWVVLGTLSVLRTSAAGTGATALRALLGTALGFAVGAALVLVIGTSPAALWTALPVAVLFAAYAPGTLPFTVGQAAFTVVISVLYNLIVPVGWQIGVVRIEDVAIGCAVSLAVGALLWPRGAGAVVGDDLADAYRHGADYLSHAVAWALGARPDAPRADLALTAAGRVDDAMRGFLAEQGTKRVAQEDLWRLVGGVTRLRLTAYSLAGLTNAVLDADTAALEKQTAGLAGWYERLASQLGPPSHRPIQPLPPPDLDGVDAPRASCALWVQHHLRHLGPHLSELTAPAAAVATQRRRPWWR